MRIAFLTHQWPGARMGGIGSCVRQTAAALADAGHDVHVFTFTLPADLQNSIPTGVHVHQVPGLAARVEDGTLDAPLAAAVNAGGEGIYRLALGSLLCAAVLKVHTQHAFDIVETPEVEALGLPLMLNADFHVPVVTHLHCCTAIAHDSNSVATGQEEKLIHSLEFAAMQYADRLCAPTQAVVNATRVFTNLPTDVAIIPHPYTCPATPFEPPTPGGPMLFVGRIEHLKGVTLIAQALNAVLKQMPQATFRFIGPDTSSGPNGRSMRQHLEAIIETALRPRVSFLGEVAHARIQAELKSCSFCVLPSLRENFSMALCEAFAAGRTAIVGQGTGSVELVADAGVVVAPDPKPLANAMLQLLKNPHQLVALSRRAHQRIRNDFAPALIAARRVAFYEDVLANPRRREPEAADPKLAALVKLAAALTGTAAPAETPGSKVLHIMNHLSQQTGKPAEVLLYGAGKYTARVLAEKSLWESRGHRVAGLIDDHPRFAEAPVHLNLPVRSLSTALAAGQPTPVVLSTDTYQDQFWTQTAPLRARGIPVFRLDSPP